MPYCNITWNPDIEAYEIKCSYDSTFINYLKTIPSKGRSYDPDTKIWIVDKTYFVLTKFTADKLFGSSHVALVSEEDVKKQEEKKEQERAKYAHITQSTGDLNAMEYLTPRDQALLRFIRQIPEGLLPKIYKMAALELHPDRNQGSHEKMALLNKEWTVLQNTTQQK